MKEKQTYRQIFPFLLLGTLSLFFCWLFAGRYGIFGSKVDWISQHSVLPDYFRRQFYETGELFPEYAANIGGGQNIYHFSYYGLYSPMILLSYLFPFVKMGDYLMAASMLSLAGAVMLLYQWLRKCRFSVEVSFFTAFMFLLSGPMIFHSYSQVMFVNYMPFLCMALMGVDRHFEKGKSGLYAVSVFLMIMTSFYFSIGGMLALILYGVYRYFQRKDINRYPYIKDEGWNMQVKEKRLAVKIFFLDGIWFCFPMLSAVLMGGILLIPTAAALTGRESAKERGFSLVSLLLPNLEVGRLVYTPYGIGLTTFMITVLITGLAYRKCFERILAYGCVAALSLPVFSWMLNGGLYIRDKALIPFLPLLCYLIADYLKKMKEGRISFAAGLIPCLLTILLLSTGRLPSNYLEYKMLILLDAVVMAVCYLLFVRKRNLRILWVPPLLFLILFGSVFHQRAGRVENRKFYEKVTDEMLGQMVEETLDGETGFYRLEQAGEEDENGANLNRVWNMGQYISSLYSSSYNAQYQEFRKNVFQVEEPFRNDLMQSVSRNPVFLDLMGVRYLLSRQDMPGYEAVNTAGGYTVYENSGAAPIAYVTDHIISEKEYEKLIFPYNQLAFAYGAVAGTDEGGHLLEKAGQALQPIEFVLPEKREEDMQIRENGKGFEIQAEKKKRLSVEVPGVGKMKEETEKIFFLQFQIENHQPMDDVAVWLEGVRNKLTSKEHIYYNGNTTFSYAVMLGKGQESVEFTLGKGNYEITGIRCFLAEWGGQVNRERSRELYQSAFEPDKEKTRGNRIAGSVDVKSTGYFITSIPYDTDYEIRVDGLKTYYEKVNMAFLGFPLDEGRHEVEIVYHAPGARVGKVVSGTGMLAIVSLLLAERKRRKNIFSQ